MNVMQMPNVPPTSRARPQVVTEPHVIFRHEDDALGPVGTDEIHAFIRDSEANLIALVSLRPIE